MKNIVLSLLLMGVSSLSVFSQEKPVNQLHEKQVWSATKLPQKAMHEGVAGSFSGQVDKWFIMAGGSYFPEGKPWQGGKKHFSDEVFVFDTSSNFKNGVVFQGKVLPTPLAEGAYASLPSGLVCIGGQTPQGISADVLLLKYIQGKISVEKLPNLPIAVKSASASVIGKTIYLVGGQTADGFSSNQFLKLDTEALQKGWQPLPSYPLSVSGATSVAQQDGEEVSVFVFGGRSLNAEKITDFHSDVYAFKPKKNHWVAKKNITASKGNLPLAVATATKVGASSILLFGGDTGETFNQVENAILAENISLRDSLWQNHQGFQKEILIYNTITNSWFSFGETQHPVAVASAFSDGNATYIVGGEQKPGIRSPFITQISFTKKTDFGWINYAVLVLYFAAMLWMGFLFMKNNNNTDDYFKGGGRIPWWAAGISIFATMLSSITFISIPAKTYATDWRMLMFNLTTIMAVPIVIRYFLPFFLRFKLDTAYQYLELRFNRSVRWIASALFTFFMVSRIAVVLFLPSLALNAVTGFDIYYAILIMGIVTIIYSTSGGMEAVIWGDVIQGFILIGGAVAAFIFMVWGVEGGIGTFWNIAVENQKFRTFDFRFDITQPVFWVVILGGLANTLISYTSDQSVVQRYMSTTDEKSTAKSIWLNGIISVPVSILFFLLGTGLYAFYQSNPNQMVVSNQNIDAVFPQFIISEMPVGFSGLLIAAIFAAAMSTLSSNINSASAVVTSDFYKTFFKNTSFRSDMRVAQWSGIIVGLLGMGMAIVLATWDISSLWDQFNTFLGLLTSGLGALFILGIFFPRVNAMSAIVGLFSGIVILYVVKSSYPQVSFLLYGLIGMISSILVAVILSIFFPNKKRIIGFTWISRNEK